MTSSKSILCLLCFLGFTPSLAQTSKTAYQSFFDSLEIEIRSKMKEYNVQSAAVALVDDQQIAWTKGFGFTDYTRQQSVTPETLFSVQSISKTYVATVALMEVSKGKFDLDVPIKRYYPEFTTLSRYGAGEADKITLRHLLSHRAGFLQEAPLGSNYDTVSCTTDVHMKSFSNSWLRYPVGKFYSYSNMGLDLAGYVLSGQSGKELESYLDKMILAPLGMLHSTFSQSKAYAFGNVTSGFFGNAWLPRLHIAAIPAGGLYASVSEMSRFLMFQFRNCTINGKPVISDPLIKEMQTIQFVEINQTAGYGLGVRVKPYGSSRLISHRGGGYGYRSEQSWIPKYKIGIVILTNDGLGSDFTNKISQMALDGYVRLKSGKREKLLGQPSNKATTLTSEDIRQISGTYKTNRGLLRINETEKGNELSATFNESFTLPLTPISPKELVVEGGGRMLIRHSTKTFPSHIIFLNADNADVYVYNDKEGEEAKELEDLAAYIGHYVASNNLQPEYLEIYVRNGFLYSSFGGATRLSKYQQGLYFSSDGESVKFEKDRLYLGNRLFRKQ